MPELPEVETIRKQLDAELTGYTFVSVKTDWQKSFRPSFSVISEAIVGKEIESIDRQAKLLIFHLSGGLELLFHLKLTGQLLVRKSSAPADKYVRSVFTLALLPGKIRKSARWAQLQQIQLPELGKRLSEFSRPQGIKELRFADARKFGFVRLITDKKEMEEMLSGFGPEPFKDLTYEKFKEALRSSSRPIKIILLDQGKISGLGNIYANDSLWRAQVHPKMPANELTGRKARQLYEAILEVLTRGLEYGGASDQWYVQTHGEKGKYQEHFLVYGRTGEPCDRCRSEIRRIEVGGRGTFFCPKCQT